MPYKDPEVGRKAKREYAKRRYHSDEATRQRQLARVIRGNERSAKGSRHLIIEFKASGCIYCGEMEPVALDAHHRDPSTKRFEISRSWRGHSVQTVMDEIAKCDCVCKNCHAKLHAGILQPTPRRSSTQAKKE